MTCGIGMAALAAVSVFVYQNGQVVRSELAHQWTVTATGDWVDGEADDLTTEKTILRDSGRQQIGPLAEAAPGTRCTLLELTSRTCRWPIGDPKKEDFCFCGATTPVRGRPYCEFHIGVAYHAPAQRK
jgi:hypothetical protein